MPGGTRFSAMLLVPESVRSSAAAVSLVGCPEQLATVRKTLIKAIAAAWNRSMAASPKNCRSQREEALINRDDPLSRSNLSLVTPAPARRGVIGDALKAARMV